MENNQQVQTDEELSNDWVDDFLADQEEYKTNIIGWKGLTKKELLAEAFLAACEVKNKEIEKRDKLLEEALFYVNLYRKSNGLNPYPAGIEKRDQWLKDYKELNEQK